MTLNQIDGEHFSAIAASSNIALNRSAVMMPFLIFKLRGPRPVSFTLDLLMP